MLKETEEHLYGDQEKPQISEEQTTFSSTKSAHEWEEVSLPRMEVRRELPITDVLRAPKKGMSGLKKILLWVFVIAVFFGGVAAYFVNLFSTRALSVEMQLPERVSAGKPFDIDFVYTNGTRTVLKDARISLELPEGVFFADDSQRTRTQLAKPIGDLGVGGSGSVAFSVVALGTPNTVKEFKMIFDYQLSGLRGRFDKKFGDQTTIGDPALQVDIVLPNKVQSGEQFNFEIHYTNNLDASLENAWVKMETPLGFSLKFSRPELTSANFWKLGTIKARESGVIFVSGVSSGQGGGVLRFNVIGGVTLKNNDIDIVKKETQSVIAASPFALAIVPEGQDLSVVKPGDALRYKIVYKNVSGTALNDVIIRARLVGSMFDVSRTRSNEGFVDPRDHTVTWTAAKTPALKVLNINEEGSVNFDATVLREYPITSLGDKNFVLRVEAEVDSLSVPAFLQVQKSLGQASYESKVSGTIQVDALAFFRDAQSGIVNKGPFPPKINEPTNYTIHWRIKSYGGDVSNIEVRSVLPPNASFTGKLAGNYGTNPPEFNERTKEMVWKVPRLAANTGVISAPLEAVFQITMTPTLFNKGSAAKLLDRTTVAGRDDFTGSQLSHSDQELTTTLADDTTVGQGSGIVE